MKFEEYNEDYGRNEFANQFEEETGRLSALQSLLLGEELGKEEVASIREFESVKKFLDLPIGDKCEVVLKKMFAYSVIVAKNKGVLPFELPDSPVAIASLVDEGLTRLKVAYKTGKGELDVIEAADAMIDSLSVRIVTVADKVIDRGVPVLLDKLCMVMTKVYPPTAVLVPYVKATEKYVNAAAKVLVRKGMGVITQAAKSVVRKVVSAGKKVAAKIKNFLKA